MPSPVAFRFDVFALFIALGIGQGGLLAWFFLRHKALASRLLGVAMLSLSLLITDVWLSYTYAMFRVLWLVDVSEPLNFVFAPLLFLSLRFSLEERPWKRTDWLHFIPALLYFLYAAIALYPMDQVYKYNAYLSAWLPEMPRLPWTYTGTPWRWVLQDYLIDLTILHVLAYALGSLRLVIRVFRREGLPFWSGQNARLKWFRSLVLMLFCTLAVFVATRLFYGNDLGDHLTATMIALTIYGTTLSVLRHSAMPDRLQLPPAETAPKPKYERSSLTGEAQTQIVSRLRALMEAEPLYADANLSLPSLAQRLGIAPHHLSQALNDELGQTFFEMVAVYRVEAAKRLLRDPEGQRLKIEEIAEQVGYLSKSAFNTAFKRLTGVTPSAWRAGG